MKKDFFHVLFAFIFLHPAGHPRRPRFRVPCQAGKRDERHMKGDIMHNKSAISDARHTVPHITPTRSGRRREYSGTVAKALGQKRRPASPPHAEISAAGFYIEGCFLLRAATATPAEPNALHPDPRGASAAALHRARSWDRQRGVLTKHLRNKIETDLLWGRVYVPKAPPHKEL